MLDKDDFIFVSFPFRNNLKFKVQQEIDTYSPNPVTNELILDLNFLIRSRSGQ